MNDAHRHDAHESRQSHSRTWLVFCAFLVIAGYFLITRHEAHIYGWLSTYGIWLLLLACPLMHVFMHRGHGHHESRGEHGRSRPDHGQEGDRP